MTRWRFAVGLCLAAVLWTEAAYSQPPDDGERIATDRPSIEGPSGGDTENEAQPAEQFAIPVRIIEDREEAERAEGRAQESAQREQDDLAAQQSMAESTERLVEVSWWQLGLAAVGTIAIVAALVISGRGNMIAASALKTTREMAQRELRAYITVDSAWVHFSDQFARAHVKLINNGQTPARYFICTARSFFGPAGIEDQIPVEPIEETTTAVLGPGREINLMRALDGPLTPDELAGISNGGAVFCITGDVRYRDVFGENCALSFIFAYGGSYGTAEDRGMTSYKQDMT